MNKITLELTQGEAAMICYALKEMASRRLEQAIDRGYVGASALKTEVQQHYNLADRIYVSARQSNAGAGRKEKNQ